MHDISAGSCSHLKTWCNKLTEVGLLFEYHPNAAKTCLIVKVSNEQKSRQIFFNTAMKIVTSGKRHLGAAIGSRSFTEVYVNNKVESWKKEIERLTEIVISQPHIAYATITHGLSSQWNYLLRTIPDISDLLTPLEKVIHQTFIPVLTGRPPPSKHECDLLALLARLGGLGLTNYKFNNFIICVFQSF